MGSEDLQQDGLADLPLTLDCPAAIKLEDTAILCAAGFEERTMALARSVLQRNCAVGVVVYEDWATDNRTTELYEAYGSVGLTGGLCHGIAYDRHSPDRFAENLKAWLLHTGKSQVFLDVSTMSRLAIMLSLDVCRETAVSVKIFYAEAAEYGPSREEYESAKAGGYPRPSIQVYSGLCDVIRTRRLSSVALQGEPTALIAFMSMNEVLTQALINCISPTRLFLINGRPPIHSWRELATAWIHEQLRGEWPERDNPYSLTQENVILPERSTSTLNYQETASVLVNLYWDYSAEYRIVLAPTGSKMQTVGCYIAKSIHPDFHIEYPTPESFLPKYSKGIGSRWLVDFGVLNNLIQSLRTKIFAERLLVLKNDS